MAAKAAIHDKRQRSDASIASRNNLVGGMCTWMAAYAAMTLV